MPPRHTRLSHFRRAATALALFVLLLTPQAGADVRPAKTWFAPHQPIEFRNEGREQLRVVVTTFAGEPVDGGDVSIPPGRSLDAREILLPFPAGTYLLHAREPDAGEGDFVGSPWIIDLRGDNRGGAPIARVDPLRFAVIETDRGDVTVAFYYDVAPHTVHNFLDLAEGGFYDELSFHRVVPGFVIQGGDPREDSTGGPGYRIQAEFNHRPHLPGVLSMARQPDPLEAQGAMPRHEAANSAGSQFFICLDYETTRRLDGRYTAFGRVVEGMDVVEAIGNAPVAHPEAGQPVERQTIRRIRVERVTAGRNPYARLRELEAAEAAEQEAEQEDEPGRPSPDTPGP